MKKLILVSMLSITLVACDRDDKMANAPKKSEDVDLANPNREERNNRDSQAYDKDNTGKNVRDRDALAKTPMDQSESAEDRKITQKIRQAVMADESLTTNAKNVKIITIKGVVTLRGPVANTREREDIESKASGVQGVNSVDNQIEVTRNHY